MPSVISMSWADRRDRIDHAAPDYIWEQVAADLRALIRSGDLPTGSRLPSEAELSEVYGVARATIRSAIGKLRKDGVLTVKVGRGTYVSRTK